MASRNKPGVSFDGCKSISQAMRLVDDHVSAHILALSERLENDLRDAVRRGEVDAETAEAVIAANWSQTSGMRLQALHEAHRILTEHSTATH